MKRNSWDLWLKLFCISASTHGNIFTCSFLHKIVHGPMLEEITALPDICRHCFLLVSREPTCLATVHWATVQPTSATAHPLTKPFSWEQLALLWCGVMGFGNWDNWLPGKAAKVHRLHFCNRWELIKINIKWNDLRYIWESTKLNDSLFPSLYAFYQLCYHLMIMLFLSSFMFSQNAFCSCCFPSAFQFWVPQQPLPACLSSLASSILHASKF